MQPSESKFYFEKMVAESGSSIAALTPYSAVRFMLDFYRQMRATECIIEDDGDMLLFSWGIYDWGEGAAFHYNLTRQFMPFDQVSEALSQLLLTIYYQINPSFETISAGNHWCASPLELSAFEEFIFSHNSTLAVADLIPAKVTLTWYEV